MAIAAGHGFGQYSPRGGPRRPRRWRSWLRRRLIAILAAVLLAAGVIGTIVVAVLANGSASAHSGSASNRSQAKPVGAVDNNTALATGNSTPATVVPTVSPTPTTSPSPAASPTPRCGSTVPGEPTLKAALRAAGYTEPRRDAGPVQTGDDAGCVYQSTWKQEDGTNTARVFVGDLGYSILVDNGQRTCRYDGLNWWWTPKGQLAAAVIALTLPQPHLPTGVAGWRIWVTAGAQVPVYCSINSR